MFSTLDGQLAAGVEMDDLRHAVERAAVLAQDVLVLLGPWQLHVHEALATPGDRGRQKKLKTKFWSLQDKTRLFFIMLWHKKSLKKIICFVPTPYISGAKRPFLASGSVLSPKKEFDDSPFSWRKDISLKTTNVNLMLLPVKPICRCSKYCSWETSVWIKATYWPISEQTDIAIPGVTPQACLKKRSQETTSMSKASIYGSPNRYPLFSASPHLLLQ